MCKYYDECKTVDHLVTRFSSVALEMTRKGIRNPPNNELHRRVIDKQVA